MLTLNKVSLTLGLGSTLENKIFTDLNLTINKGEFVVIIGVNGSGKSTLMNVISGLIKPDSGDILIDGKNVSLMLQRQKSKLISKVIQDPKVGTMENMTVFENMAFAFKRGQRRGFQFFSSKRRMSLFKDKLSELNMGLENRLNELVSNLSGGQRQVLSLVMSILEDSQLLLLDEITAALDPASSKSIMELTNKIVRSQKRTCIMITHNMAQAIQYGDRVLLLKEGIFIKEYDKAAKSTLTAAELTLQFED